MNTATDRRILPVVTGVLFFILALKQGEPVPESLLYGFISGVVTWLAYKWITLLDKKLKKKNTSSKKTPKGKKRDET